MTLLGMAVAGMRRRRLRTVLTVLSVAIAIAVLTATLSVRAIIDGMIEEAKGNPRVDFASANSALTLPLAYVEQIGKLPGVRYTYYGRIILGDDGARLKFPVIAGSPHAEDHLAHAYFSLDNEDSVKRAYADKHWLRATPALLEQMNWKIGDRVTFHSSVGNVTGTIYGTCSGFVCTQPLMFMDYDTLDQMFPAQARGRISYGAAGTTLEDETKLISSIDDMYANSPDPTLTVPSDEFIRANFMRSVGAVPDLLAKVNIFLLVVTAVVMLSTLVVSLRERRNEFGTLRAIGYSRLRVFTLIVFESVAVCVIGGALGAAIPFYLFHAKGLHMGGFALDSVLVTGKMCGYALASAAALGVAIALVPALLVVRLRIVRALETT
jgi:putative ABC transport system permease protein